jgi:hypothetical protein
MKRHALKIHRVKSVASWPSFTGEATFVGASPSGIVLVYYDATLGAPNLQNAKDLLAQADVIRTQNDAIFGTTGGQVNVIVFALGGATDGTGGADHMACDYVNGQNIEVCASFRNSARVYGLFEAELSECSMNGNVCGENTGEALSRWCAMVVSNNALADFATAPQWVADGMPNFVDMVDPSDQNPDSTGCGMAFISWLMSLGYKLPTIARAMVMLGNAGTFAGLYVWLTGDSTANAWTKFQAAIAALPNGVTSDDPFNALSAPAPQPGPTPNPNPQPGPAPAPTPQPGSGTSPFQLATLVIVALLADLKAGGSEPQLKADIQSILDAN